jgi:hypothetical protein
MMVWRQSGQQRMMRTRYIVWSDAYEYADKRQMFNDLVLLVTGGKPLFMRFSLIQPASVLELIEAVLSNYGQIMTTHVEQIYILRALLMPFIIRSLSDRLSFPITVRTVRILNLLIRNHLDILPSECEIALGLLNHMLDPEASQLWKRALCLEVFRGIYADARLLLSIYTHFDAAEGKRGISQSRNPHSSDLASSHQSLLVLTMVGRPSLNRLWLKLERLLALLPAP